MRPGADIAEMREIATSPRMPTSILGDEHSSGWTDAAADAAIDAALTSSAVAMRADGGVGGNTPPCREVARRSWRASGAIAGSSFDATAQPRDASASAMDGVTSARARSASDPVSERRYATTCGNTRGVSAVERPMRRLLEPGWITTMGMPTDGSGRDDRSNAQLTALSSSISAAASVAALPLPFLCDTFTSGLSDALRLSPNSSTVTLAFLDGTAFGHVPRFAIALTA